MNLRELKLGDYIVYRPEYNKSCYQVGVIISITETKIIWKKLVDTIYNEDGTNGCSLDFTHPEIIKKITKEQVMVELL